MANAKQLSLNGKEIKSTNGANLGFEQKLWAAADKLRKQHGCCRVPFLFVGTIAIKNDWYKTN